MSRARHISLLEEPLFIFGFPAHLGRRLLHREVLLVDVIGRILLYLLHGFGPLPKKPQVLFLVILTLLRLEVQVVALVNLLDVDVARTLKAIFYLAAAICIVFVETQITILPNRLLLLFFSFRLLVSHFLSCGAVYLERKWGFIL